MKYSLIFIARGGPCLLVHLPADCSSTVLVNSETNSLYVQYLNSHIHPLYSPVQKYSYSPFIDMKAALHTGNKICSKDFIFAQFNLYKESSIYDLSWAVHSAKYWSPRNICNEMSRERKRISVYIVHDIATQTITELFSLRLNNWFNRKKSPRNFMRSLFFLPECEYWVHKINLPPVVLDN